MTPRELVLAQFPGRISITLVEAGTAIGLKPQTSYNFHHRGIFPMRVTNQGRKPMVALTELIVYLEKRSPETPKHTVSPTAVPRRRGRPRNADRQAA